VLLIASLLDIFYRYRQLFLSEKTLEIDAVVAVITLVSVAKYAFSAKKGDYLINPSKLSFESWSETRPDE
jgi:hypothetical protein